MTRTVVYSAALVAFASATAMTLASIALPNWVSYGVTSTKGRSVTRNVGLHRSCSSVLDPQCRPFPLDREDCAGDGSAFCSMWRTTGFLVSLAAVLELVTLVAFLVVMAGGKQKAGGRLARPGGAALGRRPGAGRGRVGRGVPVRQRRQVLRARLASRHVVDPGHRQRRPVGAVRRGAGHVGVCAAAGEGIRVSRQPCCGLNARRLNTRASFLTAPWSADCANRSRAFL
ncbi:hypothetical protein MAPG_03903 [Magnaporthiopsis poae ATCC 64411]|uniref:Uncharacterized protein n=1 Tax=Magnaporthiopsis poae (strain ATCC 64411 / 73-15) TaxID=644358 RepID=A0A0C4DVA1_MAGP6|nr:hypothetical protein MAPG_03903 [Magnaporthiopsis poae ATCC 64411]